MADKTIKKDTYIWGHVGVIIYHVITAVILIMSQYLKFFTNPKIVVVTLAVILLIISLLSIIPIAKKYGTITIQ